jgi:hypothetical protein
MVQVCRPYQYFGNRNIRGVEIPDYLMSGLYSLVFLRANRDDFFWLKIGLEVLLKFYHFSHY